MKLVCVDCRDRAWKSSGDVCPHLEDAAARITRSAMSGGYTADGNTWILVLNKYHRDNLLLLLNAIGYPWPYKEGDNPHVDPDLKRYNTGDWNGEIPLMLAKPNGKYMKYVIDENDYPNPLWPKPPPTPPPKP